MLLPAKFQTPPPAALGAKIVAITPAPKPHVHQWVSVPDSKIHSRCAECGTVTLTEIVAPKVAFADAMQVMVMASPKPTFAELSPEQKLVWAAPKPATSPAVVYANSLGAGRSAYLEHHLGKPHIGKPKWVAHTQGGQMPVKESEQVEVLLFNGTREKDYAGFVVDWAKVKQYRRTELRGKPIWRHYTSVTAPDGEVRMVETDAEGWIKNDGTQPVADRTRVEVRANGCDRPGDKAICFNWQHPTLTHWRPAA